MSPSEKKRKEMLSEEVAVVSSKEEEPSREVDVDAAEEREIVFGPDQDENIEFDHDKALRRPSATDEPLDISPVAVIESGGGMVDESDEETLRKYEEKPRRKAG